MGCEMKEEDIGRSFFLEGTARGKRGGLWVAELKVEGDV